MIHELKTLPAYWDAVERGDKTFEVRRDDRGFQKGDEVWLLRMERVGGIGSYQIETDINYKPTHVLKRRIRYILTGGQFGIEPGYVVLQLEAIDG